MKNNTRVMWLLNHGTARSFDIAMLRAIGINEIFLPKSYPNDPSFRNMDIDYSEDANLTIPREDLDILNAQNWYGTTGRAAWEIANKYFDVVFFILATPEPLHNLARYFAGAAIWRTFGIDKTLSYSKLLDFFAQVFGEHQMWPDLQSLGRRFVFGEAYSHLHTIEHPLLQKRSVFLPVGMNPCTLSDQWRGEVQKVFLVVSEIGRSPYYQNLYDDFRRNFPGIPYVIGGAQALKVPDPNVLGFLPRSAHEENMRQMRLMFYPSTEPNHIHYHPFEAIRAGMPLVFMAGGILDRFGGTNLPGRCRTIAEARNKIERILRGDRGLIESIRKTQVAMLEPMKPENCVDSWRRGFDRILQDLRIATETKTGTLRYQRRKRIAVILPVAYRGGTLRGTKLLAEAIYQGSHRFGEDAEVVFAHLDDPGSYSDDAFSDLSPGIKIRPYKWKMLDQAEAQRALTYAGQIRTANLPGYMAPDDGINCFCDCDLWVIVSDRLERPLLPIRPYLLMVYDYLQRYNPFMTAEQETSVINAARSAERVLVTTEFTYSDALQYAGLAPWKVALLPMLVPVFRDLPEGNPFTAEQKYFLWTTNLEKHKNHVNAFEALRLYYDEYDGALACHITGVQTGQLLTSGRFYLERLRGILKSSPNCERSVHLLGELPDSQYRAELANAEFLWHAGRIDNGTFSVVEAAHYGIPSLSSDYPAMREIDVHFDLKLSWADPLDPEGMARMLKQMEQEAQPRRMQLPSRDELAKSEPERYATNYWQVVRECL
jgi:glycosyltransferase involved in cell wall biosynthesis